MEGRTAQVIGMSQADALSCRRIFKTPFFRYGDVENAQSPVGVECGVNRMYNRINKATNGSYPSMASNHNSNGSADMAEPNSNTIRKTFKFRISPKSKSVKGRLYHTLNLCRWLYNSALEERKTAYHDHGMRINYCAQANQLSQIKKDCPELAFVHSQVLQDTLKRLDKAYKAFFRRCKQGQTPGHPRFQGKDRFDSFTYPQTSGWKLDGDKLILTNIGVLNIIMHRPLEGRIKTVTIRRVNSKWYVCFSCEIEKPEPLPATGERIGIDVGLNSFLTDSEGNHVENPRWYRAAERRLRTVQRTVSRRKKGGKRRRKAVRELANAYEKISNQRSDFCHKLANDLVENNDLIAVEDLKIKNMVRNRYLAKSISDAGWGQFLNILSAKAEYAGRTVVKVDPKQTSQLCSGCGAVVKKVLSVRVHRCSCGLTLDRDHNAARNILAIALAIIARALAFSEGLGPKPPLRPEKPPALAVGSVTTP